MKKVPAATAASPLSSFFQSRSADAKRAAYNTATDSAIASQRRVLEDAKTIREKDCA
jgi:hypothetical protein